MDEITLEALTLFQSLSNDDKTDIIFQLLALSLTAQ